MPDTSGEREAEFVRVCQELTDTRTELAALKQRFCPAGEHYVGNVGNQSRFNRETGTFVQATTETYRCWACRQTQRRKDCPHDGDIRPERMAFGYGWACAGCGWYFGCIDDDQETAIAELKRLKFLSRLDKTPWQR